ncbi:hypothetical protein NL676_020242 [Syzygium grande]|nr:hypothetical protein NL676_020242 [Syzygium grande]
MFWGTHANPNIVSTVRKLYLFGRLVDEPNVRDRYLSVKKARCGTALSFGYPTAERKLLNGGRNQISKILRLFFHARVVSVNVIGIAALDSAAKTSRNYRNLSRRGSPLGDVAQTVERSLCMREVTINSEELLEQWLKTVSSKLTTHFLDEAVHPASIYYILLCLMLRKRVHPRLSEVRMLDFHALIPSDGSFVELKYVVFLESVIAMVKSTFDRLSMQSMLAHQTGNLSEFAAGLAAELFEGNADMARELQVEALICTRHMLRI